MNIGINETVITRSDQKSGGPTSFDACKITCQWGSRACGGFAFSASMCLCAFSIMMMAASTMAPMAIAMPPSDMMFALSPCIRMTKKAMRIAVGRVKTATNALLA